MQLTKNLPTVITATAAPGQTSFTFAFTAQRASDVVILVNGIAPSSPAVLLDPAGGGTVGVPACAGGEFVVIYLEAPIARSTKLPASGPFPISTVGRELDNLIALIQQLGDQQGRGLRFPAGEAAADLPVQMQRDGRILGFQNGQAVTPFSIDDVAKAIANATAALANKSLDGQVLSQRAGVGSVALTLDKVLGAIPYTPEMFGAVGDGVANDAPAIQRALDAIKALSSANTRAGFLQLKQGARYRCNSQIVIDRAYHNVVGGAVLDFSSWTGTYVRVTGSYTEFGNGYGQNGCIDGQIVIVGSGQNNAAGVGILYDSPLNFSCTHIRTVGVTVVSCGVAFQIGSRGYNQEFFNCKAFACGVIFDWLLAADDNDERVSIFGGTFYNSNLFIRNKRPAGGLYVFSASCDYVQKLVEIVSGKVQWFGVHTESNIWGDAPIDVSGDGGSFVMFGGWFLMQANTGSVTNYVNVAAGCSVKMIGVITNNTNNILVPNAWTPPTWARGAGDFVMRDTIPGFNFGGFPQRQHVSRSRLSDGDFDRALGEDLIWLTDDTQAMTSRYTGQNLQLTRATANMLNGTGCLRVDKQFGTTSAGKFVVVCIPVAYGDRATGGIRVRTAPDRPGSDSRFILRSGFAKLDGYDANRRPVRVRYEYPGDVPITPSTTGYTLMIAQNDAYQHVAPSWATHFMIEVDLVLAFQASFLIDGVWADVW